MIPLHLSLSGLLSYRNQVEIDFRGVELACIAGPNGAGKSSLLDAITWALFGQARKRDESLINNQCNTAEVSLIFEYEGNVYRVIRTMPRGKTSMLEFQIQQTAGTAHSPAEEKSRPGNANPHSWKPLTERTLRDTQMRIESTLRLDYETFVNASFFLQGKADQFTTQRPGDRKRILSSILGLEIWEEYRKQAAERRKKAEAEIAVLDGRLHEIESELAEEDSRRARLKELQDNLAHLSQARASQESNLENIRKIIAALEEQSKFVENLARQAQAAALKVDELKARLDNRLQEKEAYQEILAREESIRAAYETWQSARSGLEIWEAAAEQYRQHDQRRQEPRDEINAARSRLEQERDTLLEEQERIQAALEEVTEFFSQLEVSEQALADVERQLERKAGLEDELAAARQRQAEARAENPRLKAEMDELKERIDRLEAAEGANCPLCGQPLAPSQRQALIEELSALGKSLGDRYRENQAVLRESDEKTGSLEGELRQLAKAETRQRELSIQVDRLRNQIRSLEERRGEWEMKGAPRLVELARLLREGDFAHDARARLAEIDAELKAIGYDAAAHDAARRAELDGRRSEAELRDLEKARSALAPLEREIDGLEEQLASQAEEFQRLQEEREQAAASLADARASAPDLGGAEEELYRLKEQENRLRMEVGAADQKVRVLADLKERRLQYEEQRESLGRFIGKYKQLERAFGKDGVPALLIEQALPQIESKANQILERLSDGTMSLRFVTQSAYKDKRREDLRETLDIHIIDGAGARDYEMYSGGEAFRVNFAIRLALSEVLARRAGARLQTLVIDEGFGSQDAMGRQRLVEAINMIRQDFAKILVITHIDELKDAFPVRIEVEKTPRGSVARVM